MESTEQLDNTGPSSCGKLRPKLLQTASDGNKHAIESGLFTSQADFPIIALEHQTPRCSLSPEGFLRSSRWITDIALRRDIVTLQDGLKQLHLPALGMVANNLFLAAYQQMNRTKPKHMLLPEVIRRPLEDFCSHFSAEDP